MYSKLQAELVVKADDDQYADLYEVAAFYRNHKLTGGDSDWEADTHLIERICLTYSYPGSSCVLSCLEAPCWEMESGQWGKVTVNISISLNFEILMCFGCESWPCFCFFYWDLSLVMIHYRRGQEWVFTRKTKFFILTFIYWSLDFLYFWAAC